MTGITMLIFLVAFTGTGGRIDIIVIVDVGATSFLLSVVVCWKVSRRRTIRSAPLSVAVDIGVVAALRGVLGS